MIGIILINVNKSFEVKYLVLFIKTLILQL